MPGSSPPSRGAWIEIMTEKELRQKVVSPPSRGAWIEIVLRQVGRTARACRPPRGGRGLKFRPELERRAHGVVAPLAGGVD